MARTDRRLSQRDRTGLAARRLDSLPTTLPCKERTMMRKRRILVISSVFVLSCFFGVSYAGDTGLHFTEANQQASFSKGALLEDIDHLVDKIETAHADPYRSVSRKDFLDIVSRLKQRVRTRPQAELSLIECFYVLQELATALQDEHTAIHFPVESLPQTELFFPFKIRILGERMFVSESLGKTTIPEFSEVLEINGVEIRSIWEKSLKYLNPPLPHAKVNMLERFISTILTTLFDMHSPWVIRHRSGERVDKVEAVGIDGEKLFRALFGSPAYREYSIALSGKEIPVLDIPSFDYGPYEEYEKFIDGFFSRHQKKEALIIDLRRNPGGVGDWGYYMLDHLNDSSYQIIQTFDSKVSDLFRTSDYRGKAGNNLAGAKDGDYIPSAASRMRTPANKGNKFQGRVFLLVSHATDSAGTVTAAIFKHGKMGTVIGQETAGRIKFNSDPVAVKLPNSGLQAYVPVAIYALPGDHPDRGVIPDLIVDYSIEDLKNHTDKEMETVKDLI
jgi:hypothetical protein